MKMLEVCTARFFSRMKMFRGPNLVFPSQCVYGAKRNRTESTDAVSNMFSLHRKSVHRQTVFPKIMLFSLFAFTTYELNRRGYFERPYRKMLGYIERIGNGNQECHKHLPNIDMTKMGSKRYTLVMDLDRFLVCYLWDTKLGRWRLAKRPGVDKFLFYMAHFYEVVLYSQMSSTEGHTIMERLDPYFFVTHRLFRFATRYDTSTGVYSREIDKINRDLSKVIILDHTKSPDYEHYKDNIIQVPAWHGDEKDTFLTDSIDLLEVLAFSNIDDVRNIIGAYKGRNPFSEFDQKLRDIHESLRREALSIKRNPIKSLLYWTFLPDLRKEMATKNESSDEYLPFEERKRITAEQRTTEYKKEIERIREEYKRYVGNYEKR